MKVGGGGERVSITYCSEILLLQLLLSISSITVAKKGVESFYCLFWELRICFIACPYELHQIYRLLAEEGKGKGRLDIVILFTRNKLKLYYYFTETENSKSSLTVRQHLI